MSWLNRPPAQGLIATGIADPSVFARNGILLRINPKRDFNASGSQQSTTGTTTAASTALTLAAALDFANGQGIAIANAGPLPSISAPTAAPTVTPTGTAGTTSYSYTYAYGDSNGGVTAASAAGSTTTGNATLTTTNYNAVAWAAPPAGVSVVYIFRTASGGTPNTTGLIGIVTNMAILSLKDTGLALITTPPPGIPATSPAAASAQMLITSIVSGAGTTSLVLATAATTAAAGAQVYHEDSAALQNALNALPSSFTTQSGSMRFAEGAQIYLEAGAYNVRGLVIKSYQAIVGDGMDNTWLCLTPGVQGTILTSYNFAALTGGNTNGGVSGVLLADFSINGGEGYLSSRSPMSLGGWGIQKYGYRWTMRNIRVTQCGFGGVYTEWCTAQGSGADTGTMEDDWDNIRADLNGHVDNTTNNGSTGPGVVFRGPHDTRIGVILCTQNCGAGVVFDSTSSYSGDGVVISRIHSYANSDIGIHIKGAVGIQGTSFQSESNLGQLGGGSGGDGIACDNGAFYASFVNVQSNTGNGLTISGDQVTIDNLFAQGNHASGLALNGAVTQVKVKGFSTGNLTQVYAGAGEGGGNEFDLLCVNTAAGQNIFGGTPSDKSVWHLVITGGVGTLNGPTPILTAPAVPASGTALQNPFGVPCHVFVDAAAAATVGVAINGTSVGTSLAGGHFEIPLAAAAQITLTYTTAPTWVWVRD